MKVGGEGYHHLDERPLAVGRAAVGDGADGHLAVPKVDGDAERAAHLQGRGHTSVSRAWGESHHRSTAMPSVPPT